MSGQEQRMYERNNQESSHNTDPLLYEPMDELQPPRLERDLGVGHPPLHRPVAVHHAPVHHAPVHHAPVHHAPVHHAPLVHAPAPYAPPKPVPVHHAPSYNEPARPYQFEYGVSDQYSGSQFQQAEAQDNSGVVVGSYSVALPDGRLQVVKYTADPYAGYVAEVSYEGQAVYPDLPHRAPAPVYHPPPKPGYGHLAASDPEPVYVPAPEDVVLT